MIKLITIALGLVFICGVAIAEDTASSSMDMGFSNIDKNSDGTLTLEEVAPESILARSFTNVDKDGNGSIDAGEYQLFTALTESD